MNLKRILLITAINLIAISYVYQVYFKPLNVKDYDIPDDKLNKEYDFIVVGSGSSGSIVASRLVESGFGVLLIEAGGSDILSEFLNPVSIPATFPTLLNNKQADWSYRAKMETFDGFSQEIDYPRGKLFGGCSNINAQIWNKNSPKFYDLLEKEYGLKGWNFQEVDKLYQKIEQKLEISSKSNYIHDSIQFVLNDMIKKFGFRNGSYTNKNGFGFASTNQKNGRRWSIADAYLKPLLKQKSQNLHVKLNRLVTKIVFNKDQTQAIGVEFQESSQANKIFIKAKKEVILCAGSLNSPKLLLHSGIGDSIQLKKFKIPLVKELKGVGQHLQDHYGTTIIFKTLNEWKSLEQAGSISNLLKYLIQGEGQLSSNIGEMFGSYEQNSRIPGLQNFNCYSGAALYVNNEMKNEVIKKGVDIEKTSFLAMFCALMLPITIGNVTLKSANPFDHPEINLNYYKDKQDFEQMKTIYNVITDIFKDKKYQDKLELFLPFPEDRVDEQTLKNYFYKAVLTVYHPTGTCKMGEESDTFSVVNNQFKVHGFTNLRVIDASIFPEQPNGNTQAPILIAAEKGAQEILKNYK